MSMLRSLVAPAALVVLAAGSAQAQFLMVPDFTADRIMLFSAQDGSLVNANFITEPNSAYINNAKDVIQVGNQVWISDQPNNRVVRFDYPTQTWLSPINGNGALNLANLRGMEVVGNTVYLANAGAGFGKSIVTIDATTAAITGSFAIASNNSPWDIKKVGNELFISNYETGTNSTSRVDRYSLAGSFLGNVITTNNASSGLAGPQQITLKSNGNLLIGGFSGTTNTGIYEYTTSGTFVNFFAGGLGQRGAQELGDGNVLFTKGDGVFVYNVGDNIFSPSITGANSHYINPTNLPAPGAMGVLALTGLAAARRRRA
jgi:hypothetical protein